MKRIRILALALAVSLCAALVVPASAAGTTFTDVQKHWARPYIQDMTDAGILTGYGDGTFRPEDKIQRIEGFALCARVTQPADTRLQIAADQAARLKALFPDEPDNWWFLKEAATCDALGIEKLETLASMYAAGTLTRPTGQDGMSERELTRGDMTKAEFAMYLVRGMGLEELACSLDASELPFNDEWAIADKYRPYVKVLSTYGVVEGDDLHNFNPDQFMTRAVCATMLSRAIEHIVEGCKVSVELPQYTKYAWTSGFIVDVEPSDYGGRVMTINSEINGEELILLPAATRVYQYNKGDQFTALKTGSFVKVCYATDGKTVETVRVTPANLVETVEGECGKELTTDTVVIDGVKYTIDRFTQVSAGGKKGDRSIIDYAANYTDAQAGVNLQGRVLWLKLSGGTRLVEGILTDVTVETVGLSQRTSITVKGYNGSTTTYSVPENVTVTVNGDETILRESQKGRQVILRVADADPSDLKAVEVNMTDRYLQGVLRSVNTKNTPLRVELRVDGESRNTTYDLSEDCAVTYRGAETELSKLSIGCFITAKVEGGTITSLSAWQGYEDTEGTLTGITYGDPTVLEVTRADNTVVNFSIPLDQMNSITFTTGSKEGNITELRTGDHVVVTVLYNTVSQINYTTRASNVSGKLDTISRKADGTVELTVIFSDGTAHTYTATATTTVTQGDKPVTLSAVNPGGQVSLLTEGNRAISIEITGAATRQDTVYGSVFSIEPKGRIATVIITENGQTELVQVHIPSGANITTVGGDTLTNISRLNNGDQIQAWGSYGADGVFEAKLVVRE